MSQHATEKINPIDSTDTWNKIVHNETIINDIKKLNVNDIYKIHYKIKFLLKILQDACTQYIESIHDEDKSISKEMKCSEVSRKNIVYMCI